MLFEHVAIHSVAHVDAPVRLPSAEIVRRLEPAMRRLGIRGDLLTEVAGIQERRIWGRPVQVADTATMAAEKVLELSDVPRSGIGALINTSVCRDYLEPSTASVVHGSLGLPATCQNFDVGNACLAFLTGMELAAYMIERDDIDYALIVDGEVSDHIIEATISRLSGPDVTADQFRQEFASLTLGSGAAAMVLGRSELLPGGHRFRGGVTRAATQFSHLCRGTLDHMVTDTKTLLAEGLKLAAQTYRAAVDTFGWAPGKVDEVAIHQVSKVHTESLIDVLGLDPATVLRIYPEHGNIGPAAVPITLLNDLGRLQHGTRIALLGIGSGLNCSMAEVIW